MQEEGSRVVEGGRKSSEQAREREWASQTDRQTDGKREEAGKRPGCCKGQSRRECWLPSHVGVQAPQALRGVGGGLHVGDWLVEGIASGLLRLDATSSPAFSVQTLGDILEVPEAWRVGGGGLRAVSWPPPLLRPLCPSWRGILAPAEHKGPQIPPASLLLLMLFPLPGTPCARVHLGSAHSGSLLGFAPRADGPPLRSPDAAPALGA